MSATTHWRCDGYDPDSPKLHKRCPAETWACAGLVPRGWLWKSPTALCPRCGRTNTNKAREGEEKA